MKETELWELLVSLSANEISLAETHDQILRLFSVVGRSEQFYCGYENKNYDKECKLQCDECKHIQEL